MKNVIYILVAIAIGFLVGYFCQPKAIQETTVVKVDTFIVEKPIPYKVEVVREVSVPMYVPTPSDTVVMQRVDSVLVQVPIKVEHREYRDSTYRAIVSGAKVGDLRPTLESLEIYSRSTTSIVEIKPPLFTPYISACGGKGIFGVGGGVSIKDRVDLGAKYLRVNNQDAWMLEANWRFNKRKK